MEVPENSSTLGFQEYMVDVMNKGSLSLMLSIGHRVGLFDTMVSLPPSTSKQIALASNLNERYTREWLAAMVVGKILNYDPSNDLYFLPTEKAELLTRNTKTYNFAASMQWIPILGQVEDEIVNCFKEGGGVPYSSYKRFHEVMEEESAQTVLSVLFESIIPLVPQLEDRLKKGIKVLDIGCGSGRVMNMMANQFPLSKFTGFDISEEAIKNAQSQSLINGTKNVDFKVKDVSKILDPSTNLSFDLITAFDAIHDQAEPATVLTNIVSLLKPDDGIFLMQDILSSSLLKNNIDHPLGIFLYTISCLHCMSVSLAQDGRGLGAMWGKEKAVEMLKEAGFTKVDVKQLSHDFQNYYYICRIK
ncbi:MAG TPA: class I SAM-dependent methyltransferase [Nitrososphaeraceae archaeon]